MKTAATACLILLLTCHYAAAQTTIKPSMDWSSGMFRVLAVRPLDAGISPSDHPRSLQVLEQELAPLLLESLGHVPWNNSGTLADFALEHPEFRSGLESLSQSLTREWSRLSADRKSIEAEYTLNLTAMAGDIFPVESSVNKPEEPIGWVPVPEDPWTGLIVYAPAEMRVRGTGVTASPQQALTARILDPDLNPLTNPEIPPFQWFPLERRDEAETRVGRRPYRAMARELYGTIPCDLILGLEDTRQIMASESGRQALAEGRIAILIDK